MSRNNRNNYSNVQISDDLERFLDLDWDKYSRKNKWISKQCGKAVLREKFYQELTFYLGDAIEFYINYNAIDDMRIQKICDKIQMQLGTCQGGFMRYLLKQVKQYKRKELKEEIPNIEYLPIVLRFIIGDILDANPGTNMEKEFPELTHLYERLNEKKLKKAEKRGIDTAFTFDVLGIMPVEDAYDYGRGQRVNDVFVCMYKFADNLAKHDGCQVEDILDFLFKPSQYETIITTALLERQSLIEKLSDNGKKVAAAITDWCFDELEIMPERDITKVLTTYFKNRKWADEKGNDEPRRFYLGSVPESKYPNIVTVISNLTARYKDNEKYL